MSEAVARPDDELLAISQAYVALSDEKRRIFRSQVQARGIDASRLPIVPFPSRGRRFPLSHAQERLWFLWRLDPNGAAYNISGAVRLSGDLRPVDVRSALDRVLARHESLRKRFQEIDGLAWQVVEETSYGWSEYDLTEAEAGPQEPLHERLARLSRQPFDLERGPLFRVALIRVSAREYVLHFAMHHIISDGWSLGVLNKEFAQAYQAIHAGIHAAAWPLPIQYGDYALWQREWLDDATIGRQLAYWRERLGTEHTALELPFSRKRTGLRTAEGGRISRTVGRRTADALKRLARERGTTLFTLLLSSYCVLLARYSGQQDIRVGVPVSGRDRSETEPLIGFFVNTLVIRSELEGLTRFNELLEQVRVRMLEAHTHQDLPFARLVEDLQPARSLSHTPLFQTMFNFGVADRTSIRLPGLTISGVNMALETSRFDLVLNVGDGTELIAAFHYSKDVFDASVIERLLDHYMEVLEQVAQTGADLPLGEIRLSVDKTAYAPRMDHPFQPAAARIGARATAQPQAPALHCEGERLNYGQLDAWANQIAHRLQRGGIRPEERVGLCVERSAGLIAGLLGIMKSGGAFVPLDPDYPPERLAYMMEDAGVTRVLADARTAAHLAHLLADREVVVVSQVRDESVAPINAAVLAEQLAYVIYTSGSTGLPKGVAISQRALGLHLDDFIGTYGITAADKQFQSSTINFDVALHEMLPALIQGGQVEMRGPQLWDLETTSRHLAEQGVTFSRIPTAYWQQWLLNPPPAQSLPALRQITVGGEGLPGDALRRWRAGPLAHIRLDNLYGPTETTVACMYRETTQADTDQAIVSIGGPYPSRSVYVLDGAGNEAPTRGLGELCIGGDTLARGYLGRPGLTAEKFVPDPYREDGARLYRSGDLCRRREDGTIDFLGRMDQQVKLRGFRIEPGEIEAVLRQVADVNEAAVELQGEGESKRLVAYVVGEADETTLREAASARLPGYMVPSAYVKLEQLPLLPSGKVDRKALPAADENPGREAVRPGDARETALLSIWCEVLGRHDLGVTDNFFEVGGDSILSLQIIARARKVGLKLTPRQMFEHPTVAGLARMAQDYGEEIRHAEVHQALGLTPIQAMFFERFPQGESHWNQSVLLSIDGHPDLAALDATLRQISAAHDALRLRFSRAEQGACWTQRVAPTEDHRLLEVIDLKGDVDWASVLEREGTRLQKSLDIEHGPLMCAGYFGLKDEARLLLAIHHLAVDGVSWRVLLEELQQGYGQAVNGEVASLPSNMPWSAWVQRQLAYGQTEAVRAEASWWRETLTGASVALPVNTGSKPGAGRSVTVGLDEIQTRQLLQDVPRAYRTGVEDILLTALAQTLAEWAGNGGVLVALEGHGREELDEELDLSRTVGWFTTQYPVWLHAEEEPGRAIVSVKEQLRSVPRKGLHFGLLRDQFAELPRPRVGFNYLGQFDQSLIEGGGFSFARESGGEAVASGLVADMVLDLNGMIAGGRLSMQWSYREGELDESIVRTLADRFIERLRALIVHCAKMRPGATASDFPLAKLTQAQLKQLKLNLDEIEDIYPATPVQQGLVFHSLMQSGEGVYVNQKRLTLHGKLDRMRLREAWEAAVARHAVLRTHFEWRHGGEALQVVHRSVALPYETIDWSALDEREYESRLARWRTDDIARGFDVGRAPLLRVTVFERPDRGHDVVWTDHHVLMDGWSSARLMSEILRHYSGETIPAEGGLYRDYVAWLQNRDLQADESYWREQVLDMDSPTYLAGIMARSEAAASGHGELSVELDAAATARLVGFARENQVTVNTLVQGAWSLLLARHTGQDTVIFGATVAGRPSDLHEVETLLGLFINTLPMVVPVPENVRLDEWLRIIQAKGVALQEHAHVSLVEVQRLAGNGTQALFDSIVVFENYPVDQALKAAGSSGLQFGGLQNHEETNYAVTMVVTLADRLSLHFRYRRNAVDTRAVMQAAELARQILVTLPENGTQAIGNVHWLGRAEMTRLKALSCGEDMPDIPGMVHEIVAFLAETTPAAVALLHGDESLSYAKLNARANQLAHHLIGLGVGPEVKVGVALERSIGLVVGLLAVLKAGGAYVPLDPSYPADRLAYMMADSGLQLVLTQSSVRAGLPVPEGVGVLALDTLDISAQPATSPQVQIHPENLAYVIYTSGSTGRPKGAGNRHSALANRLAWMQEAYGLDASDTVLQKTPFSFDVSVWEFFWPLMVGARLAVAEPGVHGDPAELARLIERHGVTTLHFVPSMLQAFVAHEAAGRCIGIKRIVCSGEALPASLQDQVLALLPQARLYNLYGPTEAAIDVTHWTCRSGDAVVPIGRPIGNAQTYVLDGAMNLAPEGVSGELYLGGAGLGRGYEAKPGLTAERFVPDPFSDDGGRLYRTGDLARWNSEGQLEYLGRIDDQVKIRGFRIELGEVEAQLQSQSGVREAVVVAQAGPSGARLVGYITAEANQQLDGQTLRTQLGAALPEYMVPSAIVVLEALPLTANGKVDRKALPAPEFISQAYEAPMGEIEIALAEIWQQVLGVARVGRHDNFFELGGDSILSLRIVARARQTGQKVTPREIFEHPTVASLATVAGEAVEDAWHQEVHEALDLTPIQIEFFERFPQGQSHWNQSVLLAVQGGLEVPALERAVQALIEGHDALRLRFERDAAGRWRQRVAASEVSKVLEVRDLRGVPDWQASLERGGSQLQRSLDIARGPLLKAGYFEVDGGARLLLAIHHLAVDGVSWRVLLEELQQAYERAARGEQANLAPNTPWSVWVQRQLAYGGTPIVQNEAVWWRDALAGAHAALPLNTGVEPGESRSVAAELDEVETRQLLREAARSYRAGAEDILLTALAQTLGSWNGSGGVLVALEGHGREPLDEEAADLDLSRTVGWFTTRYPVWLEAGDDARRSIVSVKERLRSVPRRGLHFGLLGERAADLRRPCVAFNYLGQFDRSLAGGGRFSFAQESGGESVVPGLVADMALDLNAMVASGRLSVRWSYRAGELDATVVRGLADTFMDKVRVLIRHCAGKKPEATASDFPLARLTQAQLERLELSLEEIEDIYPATPVQQGMMFHSLLKSGAGVYVNQKRLTLHGELDPEHLRTAWEMVVARHAVLRTHFEWAHGGQALQVVQRSVKLPYEMMDWSESSAAAYEASLRDWLGDDIARGFDTGRAPLLRVALFARPDKGYDLVWTDHHVLMDGWSSAQLMGEVMHLYGVLTNGGPVTLPVGRLYREYVAWLQARPDAEPWWREIARRYEDPAVLLESLGRSRVHGEGAGQIRENLGKDFSDLLRATTQKYRVTLNTLMQASWAIVLARYGNRRNVAFGVTVSGRPAELADVESMMGLFINTVPLWFGVPGEAPIAAWLSGLQDHNSQLRQYEYASLADIQQWLGRSADALFDTLLVFESYPIDENIRAGEYALGIAGIETVEKTHYPLAIAVVPNDAVVVKWKWNRSRVGDALAARLLAEFKFVLGQIVRSDIGRVGEIALPGTPRHEPLAAHRFQPVAARIAARSREMGDRRAVVCDGEALDYATLEAWSNRIGRRLKRLGAGPEDRVGLCMERSPALIASLLGILKSGAAFVPLDPAYPESRLAEMMDDAGIRWLVADASIADRHGDLMKRRDIVRADDVADEPAQAWYEPVHPEQLAYVIYTSGSTGKPKGVAISHGALSRHLDDFLATYRITDADRQLQSSTINFDVALHEMLPALIQGGQVVMRGRQPWDLRTINQRLVEERVTFARIPTAYWQQWLREPPQAAELSLRQITVGGEALPGDALAQWRAGPLSHIRLDNLYGPTETTVACTYRETRQSDTEHVAAPIGKPYPSRNACILDLDGNEVPAGGLGELCIGGATLARGYHDRPALTAERFAPDPYDEAGGRLYRTGDLCRRQEDGTVEFLGRVDQQVKLRGFRIEPGEIEMALRAVPGVKEAAVELRGEGDDKRLVGYIVGDAAPEAARDALVSALPQYMVPSALVVLPALPLLPSGKVDRKALPDAGDVRSARQATGPSTQMEAKLLSIWREVLQRDDIGVTDNFFEVGGDSLKALTVASLANRHRIADFSLESLFSHQTVGSLAAHLDAKSPHMPSNLFPLNAPSGRYNLFAVHPGYGLVAEYRTLAKHVEGVANLYGIQSPLYTEPAWWPKSLVEMARDYVERIRRVQPSGPYHLLGWSSGGWVAREMAFVLEAMGEEVAFLGMVDSSPRDREAMAAIAPDAATDIDAYPRSVSQEEIDALLETVQGDASRWKRIVPGGEAGASVLKTSILVGKHFSAIETTGHAGGQCAGLSLWVANGTAASPVDDHLARWRGVSQGEVTLVKAVNTDHIQIIRHPAFLDSAFHVLSSLRSGLHA